MDTPGSFSNGKPKKPLIVEASRPDLENFAIGGI